MWGRHPRLCWESPSPLCGNLGTKNLSCGGRHSRLVGSIIGCVVVEEGPFVWGKHPRLCGGGTLVWGSTLGCGGRHTRLGVHSGFHFREAPLVVGAPSFVGKHPWLWGKLRRLWESTLGCEGKHPRLWESILGCGGWTHVCGEAPKFLGAPSSVGEHPWLPGEAPLVVRKMNSIFWIIDWYSSFLKKRIVKYVLFGVSFVRKQSKLGIRAAPLFTIIGKQSIEVGSSFFVMLGKHLFHHFFSLPK